MSFELRHLRAFVAVAEELNFTRAAERLHIAQQALSTQIRQLEERVGAALVARTTRKVELTEAGRAFYPHAVSILAASDAGAAAARAAAGERAKLTVGFTTPLEHAALKPVFEAFAERRPDVELGVLFVELTDVCGGVRRDDVDIGVTAGPFDRTGLESEPLWSEPLGVALAADHPLALAETVAVADYIEEPIFDFPTADAPAREFWSGARHRGGRPPRFAARFHSLDALMQGVRAGLGVSLIRARVVESLGPEAGVVFRPLDPPERVEMALAWRSGDERDAVADLVALSREEFRPSAADDSTEAFPPGPPAP